MYVGGARTVMTLVFWVPWFDGFLFPPPPTPLPPPAAETVWMFTLKKLKSGIFSYVRFLSCPLGARGGGGRSLW